MKTYRFHTVVGLIALAGLLAGCLVSPGEVDPDLLYRYQQRIVAMGPPARVNELEPVPSSTGTPLPYRIDPETGFKVVELTLHEALHRALANSLDIRIVGYEPSVARQDVIRAAAAFDYITFGTAAWQRSETPETDTDTRALQAGVRRRFETGAVGSATYDLSRTETDSVDFFGAPVTTVGWNQTLAFNVTQPLLRNAGREVNLAELRVARHNHSVTLAQFHARVMDILTEVQARYWQLVRAREELAIQERLLGETVTTLDLVRQRLPLDASRVQLSQAEAAVEGRRAALIRVRKDIQDIQHALIRLMADASLTMVEDAVVIPVTPLTRERVELDLVDLVASALRYSPELAQARLGIAINNIQVRVGRNQLLPRLDLQAGVGLTGADDSFSDSLSNLFDTDTYNWNLAASFEYPLGNRAARAFLQQARLRRMQNIVTLQNTADQIVQSISEAAREVTASYNEMLAQRLVLNASRENLQAIKDRQEFRGALNPEFLQLRLQAEENVAQAERAVLGALTNYNIAQSNLTRITGTTLRMAGVVVHDAEMYDMVERLAERVRLPAGLRDIADEPLPLAPPLPPQPEPLPPTQPAAPADLPPASEPQFEPELEPAPEPEPAPLDEPEPAPADE